MKHLTMSISLLMGMLLFIYTSGCRVQRATPDTYTGRQLIFGNGGGFTGAESRYVLLDNGQLFSVETNKSTRKEKYTPLRQLSRTITRQLFSKADALQLEQLAFSHPGNMYYFIGLQENDTTHRATWGHPSHTIPGEAEILYHQLIASLPQ
jgi:hypothetical protein